MEEVKKFFEEIRDNFNNSESIFGKIKYVITLLIGIVLISLLGTVLIIPIGVFGCIFLGMFALDSFKKDEPIKGLWYVIAFISLGIILQNYVELIL